MAGIKNFNLTGIASDIQLGKRGGRFVFDDQDTTFKFFQADGTTAANVETQDLVVNGSLTVLGDTTTINVETLTVQDNVIEVNSGETGAGVTAGTGGIDINRGTEQNVQMIWDEATDTIRFQYADGSLVDVEGNMPVQTSESLYRESDGKIILDGSGATSATAEYLAMDTTTDTVTMTSRNEAGTGDVDLVLTTQGNGSVVIASNSGSSNGFIGAVDGTDLSLSGGDEGASEQTGDLLLSGGDGSTVAGGDVVLSGGANGGTVRIDTVATPITDTSSDDTVSTVKYVRDKVAAVDTSFIASDDTPATYGTTGQYVVINGTADGLEFIDLPTTAFSDLTDTPATLGTAGQYVVINGTGDGLEYIDLPTFAMSDLTDTPATIGTTGQVLSVNATADGFEYVTIDTSFIGSDDTPATYGSAGQYVVINGTGDGLEFLDLPTFTLEELTDTPAGYGTTGQVLAVNATTDGFEYVTIETSFSDLTDTPEALGTAGQYLAVNALGDGLEFIDVPTFTLEELTDTPVGYGTEGQVLSVNATTDGLEYVTIDTSFIASDDTPAVYGTQGQYVVINSTGDGLEFVDLPEFSTTFEELTDTPVGYGTTGQVIAVNGTADGLEYVSIDTTFIGSDDTPEAYGSAGQYVVINGTGDGLEFLDLPTTAFEDLTNTPAALGTTGQMLVVNATGDALEFVDQPFIPSSVFDLDDTPADFGTEGQVLAVNTAGDALEFVSIDQRTLNAVELADMYSSIATVDATSGAYATVAIPQAYSESGQTTDKIIVTRMTIKVSADLDAGVGFKVIVQNDTTQTEAAVIDAGDNSDVLAGVYVIDGIFQNVSYDVLQNVSVALVDGTGTPVAATAGTVDVLTEYKTVFV